MTTHNAMLIQLAICAISLFVGVVLSVAGMSYKSKEKPRLVRNAEWGLTAFLLATGLLTIKRFVEALETPDLAEKIDLWTVWIRILFLWVPINFYRHVQNLKKADKNAF